MEPKPSYLLPIVIVVAGLLVGTAIYFVQSDKTKLPPVDIATIRPVSADEHIVGSPQADLFIIEYSDIDCQYCKTFNDTLEQVVADYAETGRVAWVYRHFPLIDTHPGAAKHAEAAECAGAQGGEPMFFRFISALNTVAPGAEEFDPAGYNSVVESLGLSVPAFESCIAGQEFEPRVESDFDNAIAIGGKGTPFTVIVAKGQKPVPISGAIPYLAMKQIVETELAKVR